MWVCVWKALTIVESLIGKFRDHYELERAVPRNTVSSQSKYPWKKWMTPAKEFTKLVRGVDFSVKPYSMAQQIRNRASLDGVSVSVFIKETSVLFKVIKKRGIN